MDLKRVATIFQKDFIDAIHDSRILIALVVPLGLGLLYNFTLDDEPSVPKATVAYVAAGQSKLPDVMNDLAGDSLRLTFTAVSDSEEVRRQVEADDAELGLVLPPGFDAAIARGDAPDITLALPESPSVGASVAVALLDPALRQLAGQRQPATVTVDTILTGERESVVDRVGERSYGVLIAAFITIAMIGVYVVPTVLADESEKKTLDALVLIASDMDVIAAKALFGLAYIAVAIPLLFILTELRPADVLPFVLGLLLLSVTLVGLGLLLGGLLSANQLSTWGGILIIPILIPALVIGVSAPNWLESISALMPTAHAARLALNGVSGETLFQQSWISVGILIGWCAAIYALLLWRLSRREA